MNGSVNNAAATQERVIGRPFEKGNPGRPKGSINRSTRLRNDIYDGIQLAAKEAGFDSTAKYIASIMSNRRDTLGIIKTGASLIPKDLNVNAKVQRVNITMRPDGDCKGPAVSLEPNKSNLGQSEQPESKQRAN